MSGESGANTQQTRVAPQEANALKNAYIPRVGQYQPYQGDRVADFTPDQQQAVSGAGDFLDAFAPYRDTPLYGEGGQALQNSITGQGYQQPLSAETIGSRFEQIYGAPGRAEYKKTVAPAISESFAGPGYNSSARRDAQVQGAQDLSSWLGQKRGEFAQQSTEFNAQLERDKTNRIFGAVDRTGGYLGLPVQLNQQALQGQGQVFDFASAQQTQQQNEINAQMQGFADQYNITDPQTLQVLQTLIAQDYTQTRQSGSTRNEGGAWQK